MLSIYFYLCYLEGMYRTEPIYWASHVVWGIVAYFYPILLVEIVVYQLTQWALNIRLFVFTWEVREGNSLKYTIYKLLQYLVGFLIAFIWNKMEYTT